MNFDKYVGNDSAVLISTDVNRSYLSGFNSSYGYLFICQFGKFLLVDGRYYEAATKHADKSCKVVLLERASKQLNDLIQRYRVKKLYVETEIKVSELNTLNDVLNVEIAASEELSEDIMFTRSIKSDSEIENIKSAQLIAEKAFDYLLKNIKEGMTEREAALELDYQMQKLGSRGVSFETIALFGRNTSLPHGVPSDNILRVGDVMLFDFGAVYSGYHSDMTRTVVFGKCDKKVEYIYNLVLKAQNTAESIVKAGVNASVVDSAARDVIAEEGYLGNFNHSTGHGVGLEIHEFPNISFRNSKPLYENQIITCEPGIYLPNEFGIRIEDMLVVKNNMSKNLTNAEKTLIIL